MGEQLAIFDRWCDEWLAVATDGLCEQAVERVDDEIRAHCRVTIQNELEQGLSFEAALTNAFDSLGDPYKARREFRKVHLTLFDRLRVQRIGRFSPGVHYVYGIAFAALWVSSYLASWDDLKKCESPWLEISWCVFVGAIVLAHVTIHLAQSFYHSMSPSVRVLASSEAWHEFALSGSFWLGILTLHQIYPANIGLIQLLMIVPILFLRDSVSAISIVKLYIKLRRIDPNETGLPQ
jgi:hypothetical protein